MGLFGDDGYAIVEDACYEGDYHNDNMETTPYDESLKRIKYIVLETIRCFIKESSDIDSSIDNKIGKWNVLEGDWRDCKPHGLECKGIVQKVRMYDNSELIGDKFETVALFRRKSNGKFFFSKIVPIKGTRDTKWKVISRNQVPKEILDDLQSITSHQVEPCLQI